MYVVMPIHKQQHKASSVMNMVKLQNCHSWRQQSAHKIHNTSIKWSLILQSVRRKGRGKNYFSACWIYYTEQLYHWKQQPSGEHTCFIPEEIQAQISVQRLALKTKNLGLPHSLQCKCQDSTPSQATNASIHILSNTSLTNHHIIEGYKLYWQHHETNHTRSANNFQKSREATSKF